MATISLIGIWKLAAGQGLSFSGARGRTIGVDPFFQVTSNVIGAKPALHLFQLKSDDFFATDFLGQNRIALSLSFLDGKHLFEFLLRDFINTERHCHPDGVIAMHDCCPRDHAMTTRDLDNLPERSWTGDVWKIIPILQQYRPDLTIRVLNCEPTGLVLVSGLAPGNDVLEQNYDAIIKAYGTLDLKTYGVKRFYSAFTYTDAQTYLNAGAPELAKVALDATHVLKPIRITP